MKRTLQKKSGVGYVKSSFITPTAKAGLPE